MMMLMTNFPINYLVSSYKSSTLPGGNCHPVNHSKDSVNRDALFSVRALHLIKQIAFLLLFVFTLIENYKLAN